MYDSTVYPPLDIPDDQVCMYDGFIHILGHIDKEPIYVQRIINAEYTEPVSLADIEREYPYVEKVIFEDALHGEIYKYEPYTTRDGEEIKWQKHGTTRGYA